MGQTTSISQVFPGAILSTNIYDVDSKVLLREGAKLNEKMLGLLKERGREYVEVQTEGPSTVKRCEVCQNAISLQLPRANDTTAATWACQDCDSVYFGLARSANLIPVDVLLKPTRSVSLSGHIAISFSESWNASEEGSERREHERQIITLPITVVPLDHTFRVMGESIELETQDVSRGGVCLKHIEKLGCPFLYLELQIDGRRVRRLAEIVRTRKCGAAFEIGCKFLCSVEGHSSEPKPICSAPNCRKLASCEVFRQDICLQDGEIICERDDSCPYLCRAHMIHNERFASGTRKPRGLVSYPFTNQQALQGYSIYTPLKGN